MRVLCCLDGTNVGQVSKATEMLSAAEPVTLGILFVTDTGPTRRYRAPARAFSAPPRTSAAKGRGDAAGREIVR